MYIRVCKDTNTYNKPFSTSHFSKKFSLHPHKKKKKKVSQQTKTRHNYRYGSWVITRFVQIQLPSIHQDPIQTLKNQERRRWWRRWPQLQYTDIPRTQDSRRRRLSTSSTSKTSATTVSTVSYGCSDDQIVQEEAFSVDLWDNHESGRDWPFFLLRLQWYVDDGETAEKLSLLCSKMRLYSIFTFFLQFYWKYCEIICWCSILIFWI